MTFLGKHFILIMCHSKSATLPVHLFVSLFVNVQVLYLTIFNAEYFSRFYFELYENFKGRAVDKLLNGSRVTSPAVYFWKAKLEFVSRQHGFPTKPKV